ncbi:MAG: hypothetical protein J6Q27_04205 [Clostridia bacterium]|nr:hypothetical protein [Clostridia bacterium]
MKNDISMKIISLLFAIIMWFYIIQVQSPEIEKTVKDIPVLFTQKAELEGRNLTLINDKEYTVDLKVRGQRKYLVDLNKSNVSVLADVGGLDKGTHSVYTNVVVPYGNVEVVNQRPSVVMVSVDEIVETEKDIRVTTHGNPADGYHVGTIKVTPSKMKVRGAKSIVGGIDHIAATIDVSDKSEDISTVESFELIGTADKVINTSYVTTAQDTIDVHCDILKKKTVGIDLKFEAGLNTGNEWYTLDDNSLKTIEVAGTASAIERLERVETQLITRHMIREDGEVEVQLVLPAGIESLDGEKITLKLKKNTQ